MEKAKTASDGRTTKEKGFPKDGRQARRRRKPDGFPDVPFSNFRFLLSARAKGAQRWSCSNLPISAFQPPLTARFSHPNHGP